METNALLESEATSQTLQRHLRKLASGDKRDGLIVLLFCLNFLTLFVRPQDLSGLGFLGAVRFPMIITVLTGFAVLTRLSNPWPIQVKIAMTFLFVEAFRGGLGYLGDPHNAIVKNDFWQFQTWKDLMLQFFGVILPIQLVMTNPSRFRLIYKLGLFIAFALGLYSVTHSGTGPGGFLGDENDNCFVLVMFLPFALLAQEGRRSIFLKAIAIIAAIFCLGGALATNSRGGFLGIVAVLGSLFLLSRRKLVWIFAGVIVGISVLPFIPADYWQEVSSISSDTQGRKGTIRERLDTWAIVFDMWKDPKNSFTGVGLSNSPWNLQDYEPISRGRVERSLAGRAVHSMYFQLLGDLGLWGVGIIGWLILSSLLQLRKIGKQTKKILPLVEKWKRHLNQVTQEHVTAGAVDDELKEGSQVLRQLEDQFTFHRDSAPMIICSWLGALAAAVGVSVLYYPPIWFLAALSGALFLHFTKLMQVLKEVSELMEERFGYGGVGEEGEG